jgi:hypothetical protein
VIRLGHERKNRSLRAVFSWSIGFNYWLECLGGLMGITPQPWTSAVSQSRHSQAQGKLLQSRHATALGFAAPGL